MFPNPQDRINHEKYQMNLPKWDKFIIWSYTLGSGTVNRYLNGLEVEPIDWVKKLLNLYKSNFSDSFEPPYLKNIFLKPSLFETSPDKLKISKILLEKYIANLKRIIHNAPSLTSDIKVYKTSGKINKFEVGNSITQNAFNSSTFRKDTDLIPFLRDNHCCYHEMRVSKRVNVLFISDVLSAYPDEKEVLLSPGCIISVQSKFQINLYKSLREKEKTQQVQREPLKIGQVFMTNHMYDCPQKKFRVNGYRSIVTTQKY